MKEVWEILRELAEYHTRQVSVRETRVTEAEERIWGEFEKVVPKEKLDNLFNVSWNKCREEMLKNIGRMKGE